METLAQRERGTTAGRAPSVAYVVSRFPKASETFVAREASAVAALGSSVRVYTLVRERRSVVHPEAAPLVEDSVAARDVPLVRAQLAWLLEAPGRYMRTLRDVIAGNRSSIPFLVRAVIVFPVAAAWARQIRRSDVDLVHAHFATHSALAAYVVHRLTGVPFTFTAHAHDLYTERAMLTEKVAAAAAVVTISERNAAILEQVAGDGCADRIHVIRCGVDVDRYQARRAHGADGVARVLCVATLEEKKGHQHLLRAIALLTKRGIQTELVLIGDGRLRAPLRDLAEELGIGDRVRWRGSQTSDEVVRELGRATCFALASVVDAKGRTEGIPVALMEAMAAGVPVVASDVSGVAELVRPGTGWLVPPGDHEALADALTDAIASSDRHERVERARAVVRAEYDLWRNARRLRALFAAITSAREPIT